MKFRDAIGVQNPEGPARHLDVSRQKLSETSFDSQTALTQIVS